MDPSNRQNLEKTLMTKPNAINPPKIEEVLIKPKKLPNPVQGKSFVNIVFLEKRL